MGILSSKIDRYIDVDLSFTRHPATADVSKKIDSNAISQAIKNIILTNYYEVPFQPSFGGGIYNLLFEPVSMFTAMALESNIEYALERFEPRIIVDDISIVSNNENQEYSITIYYRLRSQPDTSLAANLLLERIR